MKHYIEDWSYIPQQAFLFIPNQDQILVGSDEKQWRKIFEGGQQYSPFETKALNDLQQQLVAQKITIDPWFDRENRLRFLQANKFKISKAVQSMKQTTKWRKSSFPVQPTPAVLKHLTAGALYFCGRDNQYRPIIVADIGKFHADDDEDQSIPGALVLMMEFMINNLLIEGQVENYVLIMNLQAASFSYRKVIMKILSFTSNAYRGRLFVSYILSMPTVIRWGWDTIVSKFVSENTLKKIKITGDSYNDEMWTHISKNTIQTQYGGNITTIQTDFWPPNKQRLLFIQTQSSIENRLITPQQYKELFLQKKLINCKISLKMVADVLNDPTNNQTQKQNHQNKSSTAKVENDHTIPIRSNRIKQHEYPDDLSIKVETPFFYQFKVVKTFFQSDSFRRICQPPTN